MHKNEKQHWVQTSTGKEKRGLLSDSHLETRGKVWNRYPASNKGKGEGDDVPGDNKHDKGKGKWRHCGHFVVSLLPDILSGVTHTVASMCLYATVVTLVVGQGERMSNFKPH